jgi:hypothetical protein
MTAARHVNGFRAPRCTKTHVLVRAAHELRPRYPSGRKPPHAFDAERLASFPIPSQGF